MKRGSKSPFSFTGGGYVIFENATTNTKQGDIGEARAIYEYTCLGYTVSRTIFDSAKYDLIIDDGTCLARVQVKTTSFRTKEYGKYASSTKHTGFYVNLKTTGGNRKINTIRYR